MAGSLIDQTIAAFQWDPNDPGQAVAHAPAAAPPLAEPSPAIDQGPPAPTGPGPSEREREYGMANMLLDQPGPPGRPREPEAVVQESEASEAPLMSPEARAQHADARVREVEQTYIKSRLEQGVAQKQQAAELEALRGAQATFEQLGRTRDQELAMARIVRDRMDQTSAEIAREAANPAQEGLFEGLGTAGTIARAIGLIFMSVGAGMRARGGDMSGAEQAISTIRELSMQQVRAQQRKLQLLGGKLDAQGTIIERHMANLQDAELAAKATEADLMRIALVKAKQYAVDAAPVIGAAESKLLVARMEQEALVAGADLNRLYGEKLRRQIDTKYTIPRRALQMAAARSPFAQGLAPGAPVDPLEAHLMGLGNQPTPVDPAVADATGMPAAPAAPVSAARPAALPAAAPAAQPRQGWADLLRAGRISDAVAAMDPTTRAAFKRDREARMKDERWKDNRDAALSASVEAFLNRPEPNRPTSAAEDERDLTTNGMKYRLNVKGEEAQKVRAQVFAADNLIAMYDRLQRIIDTYGGGEDWFKAVPRDKRGEVESLTNQIAFAATKASEQGVIREFEASRWDTISGAKLSHWLTDPRTDYSAAMRAAYQEAIRERKQRLDSYARPANDAPAAPRERPKTPKGSASGSW